MKTCSACGLEKENEEFIKQRTICRRCYNLNALERRWLKKQEEDIENEPTSYEMKRYIIERKIESLNYRLKTAIYKAQNNPDPVNINTKKMLLGFKFELESLVKNELHLI